MYDDMYPSQYQTEQFHCPRGPRAVSHPVSIVLSLSERRNWNPAGRSLSYRFPSLSAVCEAPACIFLASQRMCVSCWTILHRGDICSSITTEGHLAGSQVLVSVSDAAVSTRGRLLCGLDFYSRCYPVGVTRSRLHLPRGYAFLVRLSWRWVCLR